MKHVTLTELRRNIFRLVDEAIETGEPIVIDRHGRRVTLTPESALKPAPETEAERAARWRAFWAEPPPPGMAEAEDLTPAEIRRLRQEYWRWDGETKLDE